jgi:O-antigen/teichoic acid export membrane protein
MAGAAILNVILNFALVPTFGKVGSAVATLIAQALTPIYLFYRSQQLYRIPYRFAAGVAIVLATLILIAAGAQLNVPSLALSILIKLGLLALFVPMFFVLELATVGQVRRLLSSMIVRFRGVQA